MGAFLHLVSLIFPQTTLYFNSSCHLSPASPPSCYQWWCQAKSMSICLQSLFTASTPLPPLMNQRSAHPECREPINRCEKLGIVGNRIRTTDIFCQFQVWRHLAFGRPAPQEGHSSLLSYASSPKKESGVLKRKRPLSLKSRSISKSLAIFPTLCATSR